MRSATLEKDPVNERTLTFGVVRREDAQALAAFFERVGSPCYCQYWRFNGNTNAWLARCSEDGENARALAIELEEHSGHELTGVIARDASAKVVGWVRLTPSERLRKIYDQRLYHGLECFRGERAGVYTVGCFLVDPEQRRQGVATGLLRAGIEAAQAAGARAVEAFPRRAELLGDEECQLGPYALFEREGFELVHDFGPYPVLRRVL